MDNIVNKKNIHALASTVNAQGQQIDNLTRDNTQLKVAIAQLNKEINEMKVRFQLIVANSYGSGPTTE